MEETARTKTRRAAVKIPSLEGMRNRGCKCRLEDGFRLGAQNPCLQMSDPSYGGGYILHK